MSSDKLNKDTVPEVSGYIREQEEQLQLFAHVPFYLQQICNQFYGYPEIWIKSGTKIMYGTKRSVVKMHCNPPFGVIDAAFGYQEIQLIELINSDDIDSGVTIWERNLQISRSGKMDGLFVFGISDIDKSKWDHWGEWWGDLFLGAHDPHVISSAARNRSKYQNNKWYYLSSCGSFVDQKRIKRRKVRAEFGKNSILTIRIIKQATEWILQFELTRKDEWFTKYFKNDVMSSFSTSIEPGRYRLNVIMSGLNKKVEILTKMK